MKMKRSHIASVIIALLFSYSSAQSQMTTAEKAREFEQSVIPHLKILLKENYDTNASLNENIFKIPTFLNSQAADSVNEEIITQIDTAGVWENIAKLSFIYNNQMLIRNIITSFWNGTAWENFIRFRFSYNAAGDITQFVFTFWAIDSWLPVSVNRVSYDDNGFLTEELLQLWDGTSWVNDSRVTNTYTQSGLLDISLSQDWVARSWENVSQNLYSYVQTTDTLQQIIRQLWTVDIWVNDVLDSYTFDSTGNVIEIEYFVNGPSGDEQSSYEFFKAERDVWVYDGLDYVSEFRTDRWIAIDTTAGHWEDSLRTISNLNRIGTILLSVAEESIDSVWTNVLRITVQTTELRGNLQEIINDFWIANTWEPFLRSLYSYRFFVSVVDEEFTPNDFRLSQNYPNPFNPETTINFDLPRSGHTLLTIYNLSGEEVVRLADGNLNAGAHSFSWDATRYASGVYFYQLKQNGIISTKKMLLLK